MAERFEAKTYRTLLLFSFALFMQATAALSIVGIIPSLAAEWHLPPDKAALLVTAFGVTFAVSAPALQMLIGHWARRTQVLIGFAVLAAGALAFAVAPGFPVLVAARVVMGMGAALLSPVLFAMATRMAGTRLQGPALALVSMGISVATVLGVPLSNWIGNAAGPRVLYFGLAAVVLATAAAFANSVKDASPGERVSARQAAALLGRKATWSGLSVIFFFTAGIFATYAMITPILRDAYGFSPRAVSSGLFLFGLSGLAGNAVVRRASAVFSAEALLTGSMLIIIGLFAFWSLVPVSPTALMATLAAWPFVGDMVWPSQQRRMVELEAPFRGLALALSSSSMFTGMAAGSALGGRAYAWGGREAVLVTSIALVAAAVGALAYSRRAASARKAASGNVKVTLEAVGEKAFAAAPRAA